MSESYDPRDAEFSLQGRVQTPPPPGAASAGPALSEMVAELSRTRQALEQLTREARREAQERLHAGTVGGGTDANGDLALKIFEVPQGATGYLTLLAVDEAGVTAAVPDTSALLWHAIYAGSPGSPTAAQVARVGNMLDCLPQAPGTDAQIPFVYVYADRYASPALVGPGVFWLVVDAAAANVQVAVRFNVLVVQPEP